MECDLLKGAPHGVRMLGSPIDALVRLEALHCAEGVPRKPLRGVSAPDWSAYFQNQVRWSGVNSETHSDAQTSAIYRVRTLLLRSRFPEARALIVREKKKGRFEWAALCEYAVEEVRLSALQARWSEARKQATGALSLEPNSLNRLTLLQIRALASFELGEMGDAAKDIREVIALGDCFRFAPSLLYANALLVKIVARDRGPREARRLLDHLWKQTPVNHVSPDFVLTLLRVEADLARISRKKSLFYSIAAFTVAQKMGDVLYQKISRLECHCAIEPKDLNVLPEIDDFKELQSRLNPLFTSGMSLNGCVRQRMSRKFFDELLQSQFLVLGRAGIYIDLDTWTPQSFTRTPQMRKMFQALRRQQVSKEVFFRSVWGIPKYVPELHDPVIWTALHRLRKKVPLKSIQSENSFIRAPGVLFL